MINVIIYLKEEHNAKDLVKQLLLRKLIASASIDEKNISYTMVDGELTEDVYTVITAQSRARLFNIIVATIETEFGEEASINSTPIIGTSVIFTDSVSVISKTIPL